MANFAYRQSESELHCQQSTSITINPFKCSYRGPSGRKIYSPSHQHRNLTKVQPALLIAIEAATCVDQHHSGEAHPCSSNHANLTSKVLGTGHPAIREIGEGDAHQHRIRKPHQTPGTHARNRAKARTVLPLAAAGPPPPRCWYRSNAAPATGADDIPVPPAPAPPPPPPPPPQIGSSRATAAAALDPEQQQWAPPPIWRASEGRRLGFGFCAAASAGGGRGGEEERVVVRRGKGGKESDADGSAVNAMAAMALSVFPLSLSPSLPLPRPGPAARAGCPLWSLSGGGGVGLGACSLRFLSPLS